MERQCFVANNHVKCEALGRVAVLGSCPCSQDVLVGLTETANLMSKSVHFLFPLGSVYFFVSVFLCGGSFFLFAYADFKSNHCN